MKLFKTSTAAYLSLVLVSASWAQLAPAAKPSAAVPAAASPARAGEQKPITISLTQKKVTKDDKGREKLLDADGVSPNDVIEYRATYKNVSAVAVKQIAARIPLPEGLEYVPGSAEPKKGAQFAPASEVYGAEPLKKVLPDGRSVNLPYNEYRQVRWVIDQLAPGAETTVAVRAKLEAVVPLTGSAAGPATASAAAPALAAPAKQ